LPEEFCQVARLHPSGAVAGFSTAWVGINNCSSDGFPAEDGIRVVINDPVVSADSHEERLSIPEGRIAQLAEQLTLNWVEKMEIIMH